MYTHYAGTLEQGGLNPNASSAVKQTGSSECDSFKFDRMGKIVGCGTAAEHIFEANRIQLLGRRISKFIAGLHLGRSSPSFNARYLIHLCADGEWRKFEARTAKGNAFAVELNLSRVVTNGQEVFVLNLRPPEEMSRH